MEISQRSLRTIVFLTLLIMFVFFAGIISGIFISMRFLHKPVSRTSSPSCVSLSTLSKYVYNRSTCLKLLDSYFASQNISPIAFRNSWLAKWIICSKYLDIPSMVANNLGPYAFNFILKYLHGRLKYITKGYTFIEPNSSQYGLPKDAPRPLIVAYNVVHYVNITNRTKLVPVSAAIQLPVVTIGERNSASNMVSPTTTTKSTKWFLAGKLSFSIKEPVQGPLVQKIIAEIKELNDRITALCYPNISYTGVVFVYFSVPRNTSAYVIVRYKVLTNTGRLVEKRFIAVRVWDKGYYMLPISAELYTDCSQYFLSKIYRNLTYLDKFSKLLFQVEILIDRPITRGYVVAGIGLPGVIIHYTTAKVIRLNDPGVGKKSHR